jgi:hypothetical protein
MAAAIFGFSQAMQVFGFFSCCFGISVPETTSPTALWPLLEVGLWRLAEQGLHLGRGEVTAVDGNADVAPVAIGIEIGEVQNVLQT